MSNLRIIPLGGMGNVTKNMFAYEYEDEILLVDCGIGFPESSMLGVDVLIPDVSYIKKRVESGARIVGMCISHAHDDHIAALPYVIPQLPDFPIYASELAAAFAMARMEDGGVQKEVFVAPYRKPVSIGSFRVEFIHLTHSIPHTTHLAIDTPEGVVYHGSDFKLDLTPVDGKMPDFGAIAAVGERGVLCALIDCLRVERSGWSPSENVLKDTFVRELMNCQGKFIVTLMSSNLHRVQLLADALAESGRKMVFIGRSIEKNVEIAQGIGVLSIPKHMVVSKKKMDEYRDDELCVVVAGSQGQPGSSLVRAVFGEHHQLSIGPKDKVVFATEPIPGNEQNVYEAIDELSRNRIDISYSDIASGLHVSGHASSTEQMLLISMLKPKYLFPIGGSDRHRVQFAKVVGSMGYEKRDVLLPVEGEVVAFDHGDVKKAEKLVLKSLMVDGLGVGDVGTVVLSDRKQMAEEGMIVVIIPETAGEYDAGNLKIVSRGFVFMRQADEVIQAIKEETALVLSEGGDEQEIKRKIEKRVVKRMEEVIGRKPLVLPVFMSL